MMQRKNLHRVFMAVIVVIVCLVLWFIKAGTDEADRKHLEHIMSQQKLIKDMSSVK